MPNIIYIPELLRLVFVHCRRQDLARWSLVSRYFFDIATPHLWEYVTCSNVQFLLLINGTTFEDGFWRTLILPEEISDESLSRFLRYAKFIKHLEIEIPESCFMQNSQALLAYAESNALLPNLRSLSIESCYHIEATFDWVLALFPSSLVEIRCKPYPGTRPPLPLETILNWLESVSSKCPTLETLELHPYGHREDDDHPGNRFSESLRQLTQLRSLHVNTCLATHNHIRAISRLPRLERLEISTSQERNVIIDQVHLPPDAFPMLQHLALRNLGWLDLENAWGMECLVQGLRSLDLVVNPQLKTYMLHRNGIPYDLAPRLHQLTRLVINFEFLDNCKTGAIDEFDLESLSPLPLEYALICGAKVVPIWEERKHPCEILASIWPNIQELHWPDQPATSRDLAYFAALPSLRHLTLNIKLMPAPTEIESIVTRRDTFRVLECSKPKPFRSTTESRQQVA
ncbi:hypothetical protein FRC08_007835, partial [Ceratobasidium sp. 394]